MEVSYKSTSNESDFQHAVRLPGHTFFPCVRIIITLQNVLYDFKILSMYWNQITIAYS